MLSRNYETDYSSPGFIDINVHLLLPPFSNTLPPAPNPSKCVAVSLFLVHFTHIFCMQPQRQSRTKIAQRAARRVHGHQARVNQPFRVCPSQHTSPFMYASFTTTEQDVHAHKLFISQTSTRHSSSLSSSISTRTTRNCLLPFNASFPRYVLASALT